MVVANSIYFRDDVGLHFFATYSRGNEKAHRKCDVKAEQRVNRTTTRCVEIEVSMNEYTRKVEPMQQTSKGGSVSFTGAGQTYLPSGHLSASATAARSLDQEDLVGSLSRSLF